LPFLAVYTSRRGRIARVPDFLWREAFASRKQERPSVEPPLSVMLR
jgi:hypothetical protein